jgi:mevalonate pyrophosphate decarboxylase
MYRVSIIGTEKSKDLQANIEELKQQIQRLEKIDLEKHFDKFQKTFSENSGAMNAINLYLTNITQTLTEKLRN